MTPPLAADGQTRCPWAATHPLLREYHDREWGVPQHEDKRLFELLHLESSQAGLTWASVLQRREAYREAFAGWDIAALAAFSERDIAYILENCGGVIRNRVKVTSVIGNARAFLDVQCEFGSFDRYVWRFVEDAPLQNRWTRVSELPSYTPESVALANDLDRRGFRFVGPTVCYAFMEAAGLVNDHILPCFRHAALRTSCAPKERAG